MKAKAKHIIAVDGKIDDGACLMFTEIFYMQLLIPNSTVCSAYLKAKEDLLVSFDNDIVD